MDMYDSLFYPGCVLNEQIARQIFDILPERTRHGNYGQEWALLAKRFA